MWTHRDDPCWLHRVQDHLGGREQECGNQLESKVVTFQRKRDGGEGGRGELRVIKMRAGLGGEDPSEQCTRHT